MAGITSEEAKIASLGINENSMMSSDQSAPGGLFNKDQYEKLVNNVKDLSSFP